MLRGSPSVNFPLAGLLPLPQPSFIMRNIFAVSEGKGEEKEVELKLNRPRRSAIQLANEAYGDAAAKATAALEQRQRLERIELHQTLQLKLLAQDERARQAELDAAK
jgi:hypothetical protein